MTIKSNSVIKLTPRTIKGATHIREALTDLWVVESVYQRVAFEQREGPWLYIAPSVQSTRLCADSSKARWVHETFDIDFIVTAR